MCVLGLLIFTTVTSNVSKKGMFYFNDQEQEKEKKLVSEGKKDRLHSW